MLSSLPIAFVLNVLYLLELNPGWRVRLYDYQFAKVYVQRHFPFLLENLFSETSETVFPVIRVDILKYLAMYVDGGVYLDIKSGAHRPFDDVIVEQGMKPLLIGGWGHAERELLNWGQWAEIPISPGE